MCHIAAVGTFHRCRLFGPNCPLGTTAATSAIWPGAVLGVFEPPNGPHTYGTRGGGCPALATALLRVGRLTRSVDGFAERQNTQRADHLSPAPGFRDQKLGKFIGRAADGHCSLGSQLVGDLGATQHGG